MSFKSINLNYMFNKEYYDNIIEAPGEREKEEDVVKRVNKQFFETAVAFSGSAVGKDKLSLQVRYPGLLVGLGNSHEAGKTGEIGLGFTFDYVTGLPYVPGSTVKGILKNAFSKKGYVTAVLGKAVDEIGLEREIFEGTVTENGTATKLPTSKRDVFYDAFPSAQTVKENTGDKFYPITAEAITPHGEDNFESPNPLTLVKIKPGVVFEFSFALHDGRITAQEKLALFKTILTDFGVGAKTNVGFGVLDEIDSTIKCSAPTISAEAVDSRICKNCGRTFKLEDWQKERIAESGRDNFKLCKKCFAEQRRNFNR